jgi:tetratricopeptide (TPR) repeat protein/tRNA A-37 threonylcarbamoyl transferase component Bud32
VGFPGTVQHELKQIDDPDIQSSLAHVSTTGPKHDGYATSPYVPPSTLPPHARFEILRAHAKGGLGEVFVARDKEIDREVALKEILPQHAHDLSSRARFVQEAEITGGLEHPGVVPVYGLGSYADGRPFYAMRFIRGNNLQEAIQRFYAADVPGRNPSERSLALRQLLGRFIALCNTVAYAHSRGVLHRDLKPGNIMLGEYGETLVVDWGLAKTVGHGIQDRDTSERILRPSATDSREATQEGQAIGTPSFMSPEQASGRLDQMGPASDVYSLGATLFVLLTGRKPVRGSDVGDILRKVQRGEVEYPPPGKQTSPALMAICRKAMALKPKDRYASALDLAADIEHWLADEPVAAYPEPWKARAGRWVRRHRPAVAGGVAAIGVAAVCLAVATVLLTASRENERQAKQLAEQKEKEAEQQRDKARERFELAQTAVDKYYTKVSESAELKARGLEKLRTNLLETAAEFYEKLVKEEQGDASLEAERGRAYWRLGRLYQDTGRNQQAETALRQSVAIWKQLADQHPDNPRAQSELAGSHHRLGWLYQNIGRKKEAEENHLRAIALWEPLIDQHPQVSFYQNLLAWTYNDLGILYQSISQPRQAREAHDKALALRAALVRAEPNNDNYRSSLAASHTIFGEIYSRGGRSDLAAKSFQQALELDKQLADKHPDRPDYQSRLAGAYYNVGFYYRYTDKGKAEIAYKQALRIEEKLAGLHPTVVEYQEQLGSTSNMLAGLYQEMHQLAQAETLYQKSLAIREKLYQDNPTVPSHAVELGGSYSNYGSFLVQRQNYQSATESFAKAIKILQDVLSKHDRNYVARDYLLNVHYQLAFMQRERGLKDEAEAAYRQIVQMQEKSARDSSASSEDVLHLGGAHCNFGHRLLENNKPQQAIDSYSRAVQTLEGLLQKDSKNARARLFLVNSLSGRGRTLSKSLHRHLDALKDLDRALTVANENDRDWLRAVRAGILARSGDYRQAILSVQQVSKDESANNYTLVQLAYAYGLVASAVLKDAQLSTSQRDPLADQYAAQAVALLSRAAARDYFNSPALREGLHSEIDLASVRSRSDFQKLLTKLQKNKTSGD